jgi:alkylated DNA repair protein alkB homolog 1
VLPSFVSPEEQRNLVRWSLQDQARHPNETNLDAHYVLPEEGLWNVYLRSKECQNHDVLIQTRAPSEVDLRASDEPPGPRKLVANTPAAPSNFEALSAIPKPPPPVSTTVQSSLPSFLMSKLRWANVGWYYHWGSKQYDFTKGKGEINDRIRAVCKCVVGMVDWDAIFDGSCQDLDGWADDDWRVWNETYGKLLSYESFCLPLIFLAEPDAGIVNFYQTKVSQSSLDHQYWSCLMGQCLRIH